MFNFVLLLTFAIPAFAQEDNVRFTQTTSWINQFDHQRARDSVLNFENRLIKHSDFILTSEIRPDLKLEVSQNFTGIARPRIQYRRLVYLKDSVSKDQDQSNFFWNEAYAQFKAQDDFQISFGKINFQWGPAELLPPSNILFRNVEMQPSPLFQFEGKPMVKINSSIGRNFSLVGIASMDDSSAQLFQSRNFEAFILKPEIGWNNNADYLGLVAGVSRSSRSWIGEYFAVNPSDAIQLYVDASHSQGNERAFATPSILNSTVLTKNKTASKQFEHRMIGGIKYAFERGDEIRMEYFHQTDGYSKTELTDAVNAFGDALFGVINRATFLTNPTGFLGRQYLYISARIPSLLEKDALTLTPRLIHSLQDQSNLGFLTAEYNLSDHTVLVFVSSFGIGAKDHELTLGNRDLFSLAMQYTF